MLPVRPGKSTYRFDFHDCVVTVLITLMVGGDRHGSRQPGAIASQALLDAVAAAQTDKAARTVYDRIEKHLQPVFACPKRGRASTSICEQPAGKAYCVFLVQLLKQSMTRLSKDVVPAIRATLVQLATLGLHALAALRAILKGRPHEVEVLRYSLVRKLVLLAYFSTAVDQSWLIYCALCCRCWQASAEDLTCDTQPAKLQPIPFPASSQDHEVVSLVAGTVLNMLLSFSEQDDTHKQLSRLLHVTANLEAMMAWLR